MRLGKGKKDRLVAFAGQADDALDVYLREARPALSRHSRQPALFLSCRPVSVDTPEPPASRCPSRCALPTPRTCSGGASVRHVQKLLGHTSIQWRTIYTRVFSKDLAKMVDEAHSREWAYNRREKRT